MKKIIVLCLLAIFAMPLFTFARVGVGVNLGKIELDEHLKPGGIYNFPSLGVINTGDEAGDYEVAVTYHQDQPQLRAAQEWFDFSPSQFHLKAGKSQSVEVTLNLPMKIKPGDYFCYLEAHPIVKAGPGTTIGVAAATKTYFTVAPANIWQAIYYRTASFFAMNAPWSYVVLVVVITAVILVIFRKFFAFNINIRKK